MIVILPCRLCGRSAEVEECGHADKYGYPYEVFIQCKTDDCPAETVYVGFHQRTEKPGAMKDVAEQWNKAQEEKP